MDTTAAAELGIGVGGGVDGIGYWGPGGTDQEAWATEEEFEEAARLQANGIWNGGELDHWQQHQQKRSNGEPPLKKCKNTHGGFQGNHHHQGGASCIGSPGYNQDQSCDGFDSVVLQQNPNQGGCNSRSASGTSGQRSNHNAYQVEFGQGASSGTPPRPNGEGSSGGKSKGIGRMFFKTKLCCKFRAGTCPYNSNCNFAHGMEELRKPPPNWQEIVAQQEEDRAQRSERRGENQIPSLSSSGGGSGGGGDSQRFHKTRSCKKYYSGEGCPYGDRCNFLHDDQARSRESVAINLGPTSSTGSGNELVNGGSNNNNNKNKNKNGGGNGSSQKPTYWKTRICNKWETTGHCPFGDKCHFAHGVAELQKYRGGLLDSESGATSGVLRNDLKQSGTSSKPYTDPATGLAYSIYNADNYSVGISNQRSIISFQSQRQGQRTLSKWKGPDKISQIYGDWIDDNEWEYTSISTAPQTEEVSQVPEQTFHDIHIKRDEKCYTSSQGQPNVAFFKGRSGHSSQNRFSGTLRGGGKGRDMTSQGGTSDGFYEDDACIGEL